MFLCYMFKNILKLCQACKRGYTQIISIYRDSPTRFLSLIIYEGVLLKPLSRYLKAIGIWLWIWGYIRDFWLTPAIVYSGESISPYCLIWKVVTHTHRIVYSRELQMYKWCAEIWAAISTESWASPYFLIRRVATPPIFCSGESLLKVGSLF
jgi:hypothetical protein